MAVTFSNAAAALPNVGDKVLAKLGPDIVAHVDQFRAKGGTIDFGPQIVITKIGGKTATAHLPCAVSALLKGEYSPDDFTAYRNAVFLVTSHQGPVAAAPQEKTLKFTASGSPFAPNQPKPPSGASVAAAMASALVSDITHTILVENAGPAPVFKGAITDAVKLADASMLDQPVHGTSGGSIYRVVALGQRAKMAVRIKPDALSVRVEGPINTAEKTALIDMGFTDNSNKAYYSMHFTLNGVPPERVLAVLLFLPLNWIHRVNSIKEVSNGA